MNPLDLRPSEILEMFWREILVIEELADFGEPVYVKVKVKK